MGKIIFTGKRCNGLSEVSAKIEVAKRNKSRPEYQLEHEKYESLRGEEAFLLTVGRLVRWVSRVPVFGVDATNSYRGNGRGAESVMVLSMEIGLARGCGAKLI